MPSLLAIAGNFIRDDKGATAIEYGLIAALIAVTAIVAMTTLGNSVSDLYDFVRDNAGGAMDNAGG